MALTLSGTNGVVGAGFTVDASGVSVTAGVGTFSSVQGSAASLTQIPAANIVGVCTSGLTKGGAGFGKILQVKYAFRTGHFQTSSTSYVDTGITVDITPTTSTNKILIQMNPLLGMDNASGSDVIAQVRILRGVGGTDTEIFTERTADYMRYAVGNGETDYMIAGQFLQNLDSPSTTSAITYKLQVRKGSGSGQVSFWAGSNITVMEVESA